MKFLKQTALTGLVLGHLAGFAQQPAETATSMRLKDCIDYTLKHNLTIPIYDNDVKSANQKKMEAVSGYLPQINGQLAWDDNLKRQVTVIPGAVFGQPNDIKVQFGNQYNTNASIQADQTIYDQSLLSGLSAIKPNIEAAELKKAKNDDDIVYNTAVAYYQIVAFKEQLKLLNENERKFAEIARIQELQVEKGVLKKVDADRVQVALNNIRSQKKYAETSLQLSLNRLKNYMGMPLSETLIVTDSAASLQEVTVPDGNDFDPKTTWDIKILSKNLELQQINIRRMKAGYVPTLGFYARYGGQTFGNEFGPSFKNWFSYSSIGLRLNVPIFDGLRKSSQIRQNTLSYKNAQQNYLITENATRLANQNANLQLLSSFNNLQSDKRNLQLAKEVFDNTSLQYQNGVASLADLLNAEYSYKEAQSNYLNSMVNNLIAKVELEKSKGNLKQYLNTL